MGNISGQQMDKALMTKITRLTDSFDEIPEERKQSLDEVALAIEKYKNLNPKANIIFICTHNSRRSQLSELWLNTAAFYYAIPDISTYSGGTEATAFNPRMVDAIKRFGFDLRTLVEGENPKYQLYLQGKTIGSPMYSKKYDDSFNPQSEFIAVMVCSDADRNCPIVQGAVERVSLPFEDPKPMTIRSKRLDAQSCM